MDDEPAIRFLMQDILSDMKYGSQASENGVEALKVLEKDSSFTMVISDINMPKMRGFELLAEVERKYPHIKRVLITAYNVEDYLTLAMQYGISNIITKTTPFNLTEVTAIIRNLAEENIFGIESYLEPSSSVVRLPVRHPGQVHDYTVRVLGEMGIPTSNKNLEVVVVELLNNAIYYGIKGMDPEKKEEWTEDFVLDDGQVDLYYGSDADKCAIAVRDSGGKLTKEKVLFWLARQLEKDNQGLPKGLLDLHGRGFFISREYVDRLIVNIKKRSSTEIICLQYRNSPYKGHKPLLINEV